MSMEKQTLTRTVMRGEVERVLFANGDSGFAVLRLIDAENREFVAVGPLAGQTENVHLELAGYWENHNEFGRRLRVEEFRLILPSTPDGIRRYLGSGAIPGIGEGLAARIVARFGEGTLDVLDRESKRLREVEGIGPKKADAIAVAWKETHRKREMFIFLQGLGLTPGCCAKLYNQYGEETAEVVRSNPYRLAREVSGIGFLKADELAAATGIRNDSSERIAAGAVYLANTLGTAGHTGYPEEEFSKQLCELLQLPAATVSASLESIFERKLLLKLDALVYPPALARAELELPLLTMRLLNTKPTAAPRMGKESREVAPKWNEEQRRAVELAGQAPLCIITGGPGVGKTTVVGEVVRRARAGKVEIMLAAPTGRAAKRLSDATGLVAKTIHRLLMFDPASGKFNYNRETPLPCELLIVDEVSMLDLLLATALFRAIPPGCAVVLVGDRDQLPSVGPGTVLASFLASGLIPVVELRQVFRQAAGSAIIANAHNVNRGVLPEVPSEKEGELSEFYWIRQEDPEKAAALVERLVAERIPARFALDPVRDVQVLSPMNRGSCGVQALNARLQEALNGGDRPRMKLGEREFRAGDKVMQISNNYDKGVFNGDLGRIGGILFREKKFQVLFEEDRPVEYSFEELDQLALAYAVTVHKSQGGEFPAVVLPLLNQHYLMLQRNLLYTAMTRAKKLLILIGGVRSVRAAVENARQEPRYSWLAERLRAAAEKFRQ